MHFKNLQLSHFVEVADSSFIFARHLHNRSIIGEVFPENLASARVLEKNGFRLEETRAGAVVKGGKAMDVKVYGLPR